MDSFYTLLGLPHDANLRDLRTAFKHKALLAHPDKGGSMQDFRKVLLAFETLSDARTRQRYDTELQLESGTHSGKKRRRRLAKAASKRPRGDSDMSMSASTANAAGDLPRPRGESDVSAATSSAGEKQQAGKISRRRYASQGAEGVSSGIVLSFSASPLSTTSHSLVGKTRSSSSRHETAASQMVAEQSVRDATSMEKATESRQAPQKLEDDRRPQRADALMSLIFSILQELPALKRRQMLLEKLSQSQRLGLEEWIRRQREHAGKPASPQRPAQDTRNDVTEALEEEDDRTSSSDVSDCTEDGLDFSETRDIASEAERIQEVQSSIAEGSIAEETEDMECRTPSDTAEHASDIANRDGTLIPAGTDACASTPCQELAWKSKGRLPGIRKQYTTWRTKDGVRSGQNPYYAAQSSLDNLHIGSKFVPDLRAALDNLVVVTAIKQRLAGMLKETSVEACQEAVHEVVAENARDTESLGLWFRVGFHVTACVGVELPTPRRCDVAQALSDWRRLQVFRWPHSCRIDRRLDAWMMWLHEQWPKLRRTFVDILEEASTERKVAEEQLNGLEKRAWQYWSSHVELWNRTAMRRQDERSVEEHVLHQQLEAWKTALPFTGSIVVH
eukprot:TRINITY_DN13492_c0_g1_i2.p1 TRINITY_DN13492_c0_g1~~TRINITY_DN13492_c0_g1_i2.p1  ORF type:complete len:618 (+),score=96.99 TRINITY_DN13492_c0_g1_i2:43-1896(+)